MDGVMFMHSRRLPLLRGILDDRDSVGDIRRVVSQFSFRATGDFLQQNIRVKSDAEPLGALGDLGWYNVRLSLWMMNERLPERVSGRYLSRHGAAGGGPVPVEFSGDLFFPGDATASFYCSFLAENQQWANVSGTRGYVHVPDFVLPFFGPEVGFEVNAPFFLARGCEFNMESHPRRFAVREYSNGTPDAQETNMIRHFAGIVTSGKLEPHWSEQALATQQVIDACLRSAHEDGRLVPVG
jgi:predicted dehydrogenase